MKKLISFLTILTLVFSLSSYSVSAEGISITELTPSNGSTVELIDGYDLNLSASVAGAALIKFLFCGELVAEFEEGDVLEHSIPTDNMKVGKKSFTVVAFDENGKEYNQTVYFDAVVYFNDSILPGLSIDVQTFDSMGGSYVMADTKQQTSADVLSAFSDEFGFTLNPGSGELNLSRITGASGKDGDYAVRVGRLKSGSGGNLSLNGWNRMPDGGIVVAEFDIMVPAAEYADIRINGLSYHNGNNLLYQGKVYNTDIMIQNNRWYHMKYECNADTGRVSFWVDGVLCASDVAASATYNSLNKFSLLPAYWSAASYFITNGWAYAGLDNFCIYTKKGIYGVESVGYISGGTEYESDGKIPCGIEALCITFTSIGAGLSDSDVSLFADGKKIAHGGIIINGNTVYVDLPEPAKANCTYELAINKTVSDDGAVIVPKDTLVSYNVGEAVESAYTFMKNNSPTDVVSDYSSGDVASCEYMPTVLSGKKEKIILVFTARQNGKLVSISTKTIEADSSPAQGCTVSLKPFERDMADIELCLYAINSYTDNVLYN